MTELQKNKKRATRRKRNVIAREMKMNKAQHEKRIEPKKRREKISVKEAEEFLTQDAEAESYEDPHYTGRPGSDRYEYELSSQLRRRNKYRDPKGSSSAFDGSSIIATRDNALSVSKSTDAHRRGSNEARGEDSSPDVSGPSVSPGGQS